MTDRPILHSLIASLTGLLQFNCSITWVDASGICLIKQVKVPSLLQNLHYYRKLQAVHLFVFGTFGLVLL